MRNEQVLHIVREQSNILYAVKIGKAGWIRYILRRNCPLRHKIDGKIEERIQIMGRRREGESNCWMTLRKREDTVN